MAFSDKNLVSLTAAEHIGPTETGDNIDAKRVALYTWDGSNWQRFSGGGSGATATQTFASGLNLKYDEGATYTYIGEASPGSATSATTWRIKRLTNADNTIVWADGVATFIKKWDDRATYTYT